VLYDRLPPPPLQIVAPHYIGTLNAMLRQAVTDGTGRAANIEAIDMAGKTGTSQNWRDAWFIGYSGALVVGVWVGNDDGSAMRNVTGGGLPAKIWTRFMAAHQAASADISLPGGPAPTPGLKGLVERLFGG